MRTQYSQLRDIFISTLMALVLFGCAFQNTSIRKIAGRAMEPNFYDGQLVVVEQVELSKLQRGDVIIYEYDGETYLKRLIGLPGETIEIHDGRISIDGKIFDEPYKASVPSYEESRLRLGEDEFYVLGDNRDNSFDSHLHGPISGEQLLGRVVQQ